MKIDIDISNCEIRITEDEESFNSRQNATSYSQYKHSCYGIRQDCSHNTNIGNYETHASHNMSIGNYETHPNPSCGCVHNEMQTLDISLSLSESSELIDSSNAVENADIAKLFQLINQIVSRMGTMNVEVHLSFLAQIDQTST
jgi:hypothetical protein